MPELSVADRIPYQQLTKSAVEQEPASAITPCESIHAGLQHDIDETALVNPACFVCGQENAGGMRLAFRVGNGRASAQWTSGARWESYKGVVHGGIISTLLDEAMSKAILCGGDQAFTADLRIRFRKKVNVGDVVTVEGWVVEIDRRRILAEGSLVSEDGEERVHAWGIFLRRRSV